MPGMPLPNPPQMGMVIKSTASFAARAGATGSLRTLRLNCILLIIIFGSLVLNSQNIVNPQKSNEEIFLARTKQLNQFIDRFNLKTDFRGNPADAAFLAAMPRDKMLSMLFDLKDPRTLKGNARFDQAYSDLKKAFIAETSGRDLKIDKFSAGVIAEARTRVTYKGQPAFVSLFLYQENAGKGGVKWVLAAARSDLFNIFSEDTSMVRFIPPSSHETDFINLKRALDDADHLDAYAGKNFTADFLATFFFCIKTGLIRFDYVEKVTYHIIDIPGWYLKVEDFNRNELNSGWLISDLKRNSLDLAEFLKGL